MNRQILKSNSAFVVIGDAPAWKTGEEVGRLFQLVQSADFSITNERQKIKQIGSQQYVVDDILRSPEASISLNYYLTPYLSNEILFGFQASGDSYQPCLSGMKSRNQNIYLFIDPEDTKDGFDEVKKPSGSFSGIQALTFGNCYLTNYSLDFAIGAIPRVSTTFASCNARFENITGRYISIPAINSVSGNNLNSGFLDMSGLSSSLLSGYVDKDPESRNEFNPPVVLPHYSTFTMENLQVGGVPLQAASNPILQSLSMSLDMTRTPLYGLGSNYPYDRKMELPVNGNVQISCLVSGVSSGNFQQILTEESGYDFELTFTDDKSSNTPTGFYKIENAKMESMNFSMAVNDIMQFNASFSFQANEIGGLKTKRSSPLLSWQSFGDIWQNINVTWQAL